MEPKYSVLLCNQSYIDYKNRLSEWLLSGIKVFWFGSPVEASDLKSNYAAFAKELLLQAFVATAKKLNILCANTEREWQDG